MEQKHRAAPLKPHTRHGTSLFSVYLCFHFTALLVGFNSFVPSAWCVVPAFNSTEAHSSKPTMSNIHTVLYIKYYAWRDFSLSPPVCCSLGCSDEADGFKCASRAP